MKRSTIGAVFVLAAWVAAPTGLYAQSAETKKLSAEVKRRYLSLQRFMGQLLETIEAQRSESGRLETAMKRSRELKVVARLETIRRHLQRGKLRDALEEEKIAERDLARILRILKGQDETEWLREQNDRLDGLREGLERLERLVGAQEETRDATQNLIDQQSGESGESNPSTPSPQELAERQQQVEAETDQLARKLQRDSDQFRVEQAPQESSLERKIDERGESAEQPEGSQPQGQQPQGQQPEGQQPQGQQPEGQQPQGQQPEGQQPQGQQPQGQQPQGQQPQGQQPQGQQPQGQQPEGQQPQGQQPQGQQPQGQQPQGQEPQGQQPQQDSQRQQRAQEQAQQLRRASQNMRQASERLDAENLEAALEDQEEALERLRQAEEEVRDDVEELEELQREEVAQLVTGKLYSMLAEQQLITEETRALHEELGEGDSASTAEEEELARLAHEEETRSLARRERALVADSADIARILGEEQSSIVAPEILRRIDDDLENVARRLDAGHAGDLTQLVQSDIEIAIEELIEAIDPSKDENRKDPEGEGRDRPEGQPPPEDEEEQDEEQQGQQPSGEQAQLISPLQEIRMLISAQRRVRARTERLHALGVLPEADKEPESEDAELAAEQAQRISDAQNSLGEVTSGLIEKYPIIDQFLLGITPEELAEQAAEEAGELDEFRERVELEGIPDESLDDESSPDEDFEKSESASDIESERGRREASSSEESTSSEESGSTEESESAADEGTENDRAN